MPRPTTPDQAADQALIRALPYSPLYPSPLSTAAVGHICDSPCDDGGLYCQDGGDGQLGDGNGDTRSMANAAFDLGEWVSELAESEEEVEVSMDCDDPATTLDAHTTLDDLNQSAPFEAGGPAPPLDVLSVLAGSTDGDGVALEKRSGLNRTNPSDGDAKRKGSPALDLTTHESKRTRTSNEVRLGSCCPSFPAS